MPVDRPTLDQLIARGQSDMDTHLVGIDPRLRRRLADIILRMHAGAMHGLYDYIESVPKKRFFIQTADAEGLDDWGGDYAIPKKDVANAKGKITFAGTDTTNIQAGTFIQRADNVKYTTDALATIAAGVALVDVTAVEVGSDSNAIAATVLTLISPIPGIDSTAIVDVNALTGGVGEEDIEDYRGRLIERKRQAPHGGNDADYIAWAKEVPGVTRAWCYPRENGNGSVVVRFMMDDSYVDGIPLAGDVTTVFNYIDALRPNSYQDFQVQAPIPHIVNFTLSVTPDIIAVKNAVEASIKDFYTRNSEPGGTMLLTQTNEAISLASGETDHDLTIPAANVVPTTPEIAVVGAFTWE